MATITEDYVSFETAKLLKEKGFEGHSILTIYDENAANAYIKELKEKHLPYSSDDPKLKEFYYTQPTLQMAMKWLREVHGIHLNIIYNKICDKGYWGKGHWTWNNEEYSSYEEACEVAIKYCLEHLI